MTPARVIYADGVLDLAERLRERARVARNSIGPDPRADLLERTATEIESAVHAGAQEWLSTRQAEALTEVRSATWADRCRRYLAARGLARKAEGGEWLIRASAVAGASEAA